MQRVAGVLLAITGACGVLRSPADSPRNGRVVSDYRVLQYPGGALHVVLIERGEVAEWLTNEYDAPLTVDVTQTTTNLDADAPSPTTVTIGPGKDLRIGLWSVVSDLQEWHERSWFVGRFGDPNARPAPYAYALPFPAGESHRIIQAFGGAFSHTGDSEFAVDFEMPEGTQVRAARDGVVVAYNDTATTHGLTPEYRDMSHANWLLVRHADGTIAAYWHLAPRGVRVTIGQRVARGDVIALSGFTGFAGVAHLHFEVTTAASGAHARSFPFSFRTAADLDELPVDGKTYTAFE